jgi:hypothetical protein
VAHYLVQFAIDRFPDFALLRVSLAVELIKAGQVEDTKRVLKIAIQKDPKKIRTCARSSSTIRRLMKYGHLNLYINFTFMSHPRKRPTSMLGTLLIAVVAVCSAPALSPGSDQEASTAKINAKLDSIVIPKISFQDTPVREAFATLQQQSKEHDESGSIGEKGVQFVLKIDSNADATLINLNLENMRLRDAVMYTCTLAGLKFQADPTVVLIAMQSDPTVAP